MKRALSSEMKVAGGSSGRAGHRKLAAGALTACLLVPLVFLAILKPNFNSFSIWNLQTSIYPSFQSEGNKIIREEASETLPTGTEMRVMPLPAIIQEKNGSQLTGISKTNQTILHRTENKPISAIESPINSTESQRAVQSDNNINLTITGNQVGSSAHHQENQTQPNIGVEMKESSPLIEAKKGEDNSNAEQSKKLEQIHQELKESVTSSLASRSKISCDYSQQRSDACVVEGDVRVLGHSSSIILSSLDISTQNQTWKIRPYSRKWEPPVMQTIKEFTIKSTINPEETPSCAATHCVPAIVFSTGGFLGNFFHDFTDVLVPLYITSSQYKGKVQFLVTDFNSGWINKYKPILNRLSRHDIINLDQDKKVHCFQQVHLGLLSHKELGVDPSMSPDGHSIDNFREILRVTFSLKRKSIKRGTKRPRLLILQRRRSRSFMNKREVVGLGRSLGFKVVVAGPEEMTNVTRFAPIVNSCDVLMGVHGAGLTNMMFLPDGATLIQIVPWGGLKWACWNDFGQPAPDMGVRYLEYEIKEEESSLIEQYPRDDLVFTDPLSVQKRGWNALWSVFLDKQKVKLDVARFKPLLKEALQSLR